MGKGPWEYLIKDGLKPQRTSRSNNCQEEEEEEEGEEENLFWCCI